MRWKPKPKAGYLEAWGELYGDGMRNPAAQGAADANQADVIRWYEELYCHVIDTHKVGGGFGDLVVKIPTRNGPVVAIVEVKTPGGHLSPSQERFMREWGSVVETVRTRDDVHAHVARVGKLGRL